MDILHEELKEAMVEAEDDPQPGILEEMMEEDKNQSDNDYQSCESGSSSDHTEIESRKLSEELSESAMLIQEDLKDQEHLKSWQKEKRISNHISQNNCLQDLEKNLESLSDDSDYSSQGTVKVQIQSRISGKKREYNNDPPLFSYLPDPPVLTQRRCLKQCKCSSWSRRWTTTMPT